ncbi:DUF4190 domain-containing protein [Cytophagaceae bacterium DM2B3-1]|uniref:DUF4190 domain-containing protein n=1 Tax=Xanthocytophaga flava TaxID=3048013 RepID=A0ABT7CDQ7_9BACT|nr:DUF4190 domain-containing protein [Xanthocytophaga flavus]MDJ1472681.1 DUF4190 domain-containing protein [Xanthocytophaga flavus]MDJ1491861.1 DUF4190 domain-containing protein [Xanthocytophaga flavus]
MKTTLLMLIGCLCLLACHPVHLLSKETYSNSQQTISPDLPDAVVSLDSSHTVNAAQVSNDFYLPATGLVENKIIYSTSTRKPGLLKQMKLAKQLYKSLDDSTKLYTRRRSATIQTVNPMARASLWSGIGAFALVLLPLGSGIFGLLALFCAVFAIISGIVGLNQIRRSPDLFRGRGLAIAGISLGGSFLVLITLILLVLLLLFAAWNQ